MGEDRLVDQAGGVTVAADVPFPVGVNAASSLTVLEDLAGGALLPPGDGSLGDLRESGCPEGVVDRTYIVYVPQHHALGAGLPAGVEAPVGVDAQPFRQAGVVGTVGRLGVTEGLEHVEVVGGEGHGSLGIIEPGIESLDVRLDVGVGVRDQFGMVCGMADGYHGGYGEGGADVPEMVVDLPLPGLRAGGDRL